MTPEQGRIMQLRALRATVAASLAQLDALLSSVQTGEPAKPECRHKNKTDMSTMGNPNAWVCDDCGADGGHVPAEPAGVEA